MFRMFNQPKALLTNALQKVKDTIEDKIEFTTPSLSNFNENSLYLLTLLGCVGDASADWVCFKLQEIPYSFDCQSFWNGFDLQGALLNITNQTFGMNISLVSQEECLYYNSRHQYFGSSGFDIPLCNLGFPRHQHPNDVLINVLNNNTPAHQYGTTADVQNTIVVAAAGGALLTTGLFASAAYFCAKRKSKPDYEAINETNETGPLQPYVSPRNSMGS